MMRKISYNSLEILKLLSYFPIIFSFTFLEPPSPKSIPLLIHLENILLSIVVSNWNFLIFPFQSFHSLSKNPVEFYLNHLNAWLPTGDHRTLLHRKIAIPARNRRQFRKFICLSLSVRKQKNSRLLFLCPWNAQTFFSDKYANNARALFFVAQQTVTQQHQHHLKVTCSWSG